MVVVLLLAAWAIILLPSLGVSRRLRPADGIRRFERSMGVLGNARTTQPPGRWVMLPGEMAAPNRRRARVVQRRRQTFMRLLIAAGVTLLLGLIPPLRGFLLVHLAVDVALAVYVVQLRRWRMMEIERARRVAERATAAAARADEERQVPLIEHLGQEQDEDVPMRVPAMRRSG